MNWGQIFSYLGNTLGGVALAISTGVLSIPGLPAWVPVLLTVVFHGGSDVAWKMHNSNKE